MEIDSIPYSNQETNPKSSKHRANSTNIQIHDDILFDIFLFLERKDIEKGLLVSKQWNFNIQNANYPFLPVQRFKKVVYSPAFGRFRWNVLNQNFETLCLKSLPSKFFEISIFEEIEFYMRNKKEVEEFMEIIKSKQIKLEFKMVIFNFYWGEIEDHWSDEERWRSVSLMHTILKFFIIPREVVIKFNICHYNNGTSTLDFYCPSNFKKTYEILKFDIYRHATDPALDYNEFEERILKFIGNSGMTGQNVDILVSRYSFKPEIGSKIIQMFMDHVNPNYMFYTLEFKDFLLDDDILFDDYASMLEETLKDYHTIYDESQKFPYRLNGKEGLTINVDIKNAKFSITGS